MSLILKSKAKLSFTDSEAVPALVWAFCEYFISRHTVVDGDKTVGPEVIALLSNSIPALLMESGQALPAR